ncbi:MAG: N-6 DNA methylase, partial [Fibrobacter sp.]|nr:N-6 DNA methylase [Fibrobacter sp.]
KERKDDLYFATLVNNTDVAANDYNLSVTSYVEQEDTREIIDITALNAEIAEIVERQNQLRAEIDAIVAELEGDAV